MTDLPDDDQDVSTPAGERAEVVAKLAELIVAHNALHFPVGTKKFTLKSGRQTSYYLDVGDLCAGHDMFEVGKAFGVTLRHHFGEEIDVLFASSYGGIPSAVTAAQYYALLTGHATEWGYSRPMPDLFAIRPLVCGSVLKEDRRVVIIDDLLTTGTSLREAIAVVRSTGSLILGAVVLVDRCERCKGNRLVSAEITRDTGVKVFSCARIDEIARKLPATVLSDEQRESIIKNG